MKVGLTTTDSLPPRLAALEVGRAGTVVVMDGVAAGLALPLGDTDIELELEVKLSDVEQLIGPTLARRISTHRGYRYSFIFTFLYFFCSSFFAGLLQANFSFFTKSCRSHDNLWHVFTFDS